MNILKTPRCAVVVFTSFLIGMTWMNEFADLPHHLMGAQSTPVNWRESLQESLIIFGIGFIFDRWFKRYVHHLKKHLDGMYTICSFCHSVRIQGRWISIEDWMTSESETEVSHGLCPECLQREYPQLYVQMVEDGHLESSGR